jgi:clan AA aspartic protease
MIVGSVNAYREAIIPLAVCDASGQPHSMEVVVDTGFNGTLTLPSDVIAALGLIWRNRSQVTLANGAVEEVDVYAATVIWDGQPRNVLVEAAETDPLVGMTLLHGYDLHVQVIDGGSVTISKLQGRP